MELTSRCAGLTAAYGIVGAIVGGIAIVALLPSQNQALGDIDSSAP
jgi:hypothetical protein